MDLINALCLLQISKADLPLSISVTEQRYNEIQKQTLQQLRMQTRDQQVLQQAIAELKQAKALVEQHLQEINSNPDVYFGSNSQGTSTPTSSSKRKSQPSWSGSGRSTSQPRTATSHSQPKNWEEWLQEFFLLLQRLFPVIQKHLPDPVCKVIHYYATTPHRYTKLIMHSWVVLLIVFFSFPYSLLNLFVNEIESTGSETMNRGMSGFYIHDYWSTPTPSLEPTQVTGVLLKPTPLHSNSPTFTSPPTFTQTPTLTHSPSLSVTNTTRRMMRSSFTKTPTRAPPLKTPVPIVETTVEQRNATWQTPTVTPTAYNYVNLFYDLVVRNPKKTPSSTPTFADTYPTTALFEDNHVTDAISQPGEWGLIQIHTSPYSNIQLVKDELLIVDGFAPTDILTIQPGMYTLSIKKDEILFGTYTVEVIPDRFTTIRINLTLQTYSITQGELP